MGRTTIERLGSALRSLLHRLRTLGGRRRLERELDEELRFHLEAQIEENLERGMTPKEARTAALRTFGGVEQVKEACRDERGLPWLETTIQDVRWALRSLRRSPAFTATAVTILALGIGATAAIVSVFHGVLLRPLPFPEPERLVALWESNAERGWLQANVAPANLLDWQEQAESFTEITAHGWSAGWALEPDGSGGRVERVEGTYVLDNFFSVLGVPVLHGPGLPVGAHWMADERTVVISHGLWLRAFGGDPAAVGRRIVLDGEPHTVVGVAPEGFSYPREGLDAWVSFDWQPGFRDAEWFRLAHMVKAVARLAPEATVDSARAELVALAARLERQFPETNRQMGAGLTPLREWHVGDVRRPLAILMAAVVLVLLVASANIANLLLARAGARSREIAMRTALGASKTRLVRQLLSESLTLATLGGAAGLLVGWWGTRLLVTLAADSLPRAAEVSLDSEAVLVALGVTVATGLLFGVGPALHLARQPTASALKEGDERAAGQSRRRGRGLDLLVLGEVALATVLVFGAGLMVKSFGNLVLTDPGFDPAGRTSASFYLPPATYPEAERVLSFDRRLLERLRSLPGVEGAALASSLPLDGVQWSADFTVEGRPDDPGVDFARRIVSAGYFRTMGVPLLEGRTFDGSDTEAGRPVVVVNETLARRHFGDESPVGRRIALDREPHEGSVWREVVGVVGDEKIESLAADGRMEIFLPIGQELLGEPGLPQRSYDIVVRSGLATAPLAEALRAAAAELDPRVPLYDVETMAGRVARAASRERLLMFLMALFAALALVLASVGIYGMLVYSVSRRQREIGVRLALGARPAAVLRMVLAKGMALFAAGLTAGLAAALLLAGALEAVLFRVDPWDPATLAAAVLVLGGSALAATLGPARRAARVDPMETLRVE